jgi:hypothetical protein
MREGQYLPAVDAAELQRGCSRGFTFAADEGSLWERVLNQGKD